MRTFHKRIFLTGFGIAVLGLALAWWIASPSITGKSDRGASPSVRSKGDGWSLDSFWPWATPKSIKSIIARSKEVHFQTRLAAVHALKNDLNQKELDAIYEFLQDNEIPEGISRAHVRALKNDILTVLRHQTAPPADLVPLMFRLHKDSDQDIVVRDYALQHLSAAYEKAPEEQKKQIQKALWAALEENQSSIAGTSLLALDRLSRTNADFEMQKFNQAALKLANDPTSGELARITALQVCARNQLKEVLPLAFELAQNGPSAPLRISAIAALGELGEARHKRLLQQLAQDQNQRLRPAAQSALARLSKRITAS